MKIQAINNTNFKGLFTDKTYQNNGNWRMEYEPYSWETKNREGEKKFGMADQTEWNILGKDLPDNEKRFTDNTTTTDGYYYNSKNGKKFCTDILGTEFYYEDYRYGKDSIRKTITEMPAMNLENSLIVRDKKLGKFLDLKEATKSELEKSFKDLEGAIVNNDTRFKNSVNEYMSKAFPGSFRVENMNNIHSEIMKYTKDLINNIGNYITLGKSIEAVKATKEEGLKTIAQLKEARESGKLIDISKRDIYDPNKILWEALQDIKVAAGKLIALPHKTISVNELIKLIGKNVKESEIADKGIKIIDQMIRSKV